MSSRLGDFGKHILAFLVLLIAGWIVLQFVIHIVTAVFGIVLGLLAVIALIWALRVLL